MTPPSAESILVRVRKTAPEPGMILPDYRGYSVCNLAELVRRQFGLPNRCPETLLPLLHPRFRRIVLIVLDALGWDQFHVYRDELPAVERFCEGARIYPFTSTFPSTTTVALTGIYTGQTPAEHTLAGHRVYSHEIGGVVDTLRFSPPHDPRRDACALQGHDVRRTFPMRTVFQSLTDAGVPNLSITRHAFEDTALGRLHHQGAELCGYSDAADMAVLLRRQLQEQPEGLVTVYWDIVDVLSHRYGSVSEMVRTAIEQIFFLLGRELLDRTSAADRAGTLLLLTADHGQCDVSPEETLYLEELPELRRHLLMPPTGQARSPYFHAGPEGPEALREALRPLESHFRIWSREEVLQLGLFGSPPDPNWFGTRIGDYVAAARGAAQLVGTRPQPGQHVTIGRHGSLTEPEMLVPLVALPLDSY